MEEGMRRWREVEGRGLEDRGREEGGTKWEAGWMPGREFRLVRVGVGQEGERLEGGRLVAARRKEGRLGT
jgi:hypothetical protein